jgi:hypothetical protein
MEKNDYVKVYSAGKIYEAELITGLLSDYQIEAVILNKKDSELLIGEIEVFVASNDAEKAKQIIAERGK